MEGPPELEAVTAYLRSLGATPERIEEARLDQRLAGLAADLVLGQGADLTANGVAERLGVEPSAVVELWRTLGIAVPDASRPMFSERDADLTALALQLNPIGGHGVELFRVLGTSLARVAEAAVAIYVQTVQPDLDRAEVDMAVWARDMAETTELAMRIGDAMGAVFAHHMRDAIDRQRVAQMDVAERSLFRLAVGFVDLVGFTPLSLHVAPAELLELIGEFEARAFEITAAHDGRIVKHIGDEVMFVALDAGAGCAIAAELTGLHSAGIEPRGGVAYGDVITRHGDYYGTVVNLASRLADLAVPKEVLVDAATASAGRDRFAFRPAGQRLLKGFDEPLEVFSLAGELAGERT